MPPEVMQALLDQDEDYDKHRMGLPPPSENSNNVKIQLNGDSVALDYLGPTVVQEDGTLKTIANWVNMTKGEQDATWRVIVKRNRKRLAALKEKQENAAEKQENVGDMNPRTEL